MNNAIVFLAFLSLGASLSAQVPSPSPLTIGTVSTGTAGPMKAMTAEQRQQVKLGARQAIMNPVAAPDLSYLQQKDIRQMSQKELEILPLVAPGRFNQDAEKRKTPAEREKERQSLRSVLDPLTVNREQDQFKTSAQRQIELEAAQAVLHPKQLSPWDRSSRGPRPN